MDVCSNCQIGKGQHIIAPQEMIAGMKRLGPENEPETVDWGPDRGAEIIDDGGL
jgi:antitoxin MazE